MTETHKPIVLDAVLIRNTVRMFFQSRYDNPLPIPPFHSEMWQLCCSDAKYVAIAAPRGTAKSTAITHAYVLCNLLFRLRKFALIVSDTEGQAAQFLGDLKREITDNEAVKEAFMVSKLIKETETDFIVLFTDGQQCRVMAKGSEQKVRGLKWRSSRPDLVVGDDLENDEIVMNKERRDKFRRWFMNALLPCGSDNCIFRIAGTILHIDSALNRLLKNPAWATARFQAHGPDFTDLLWPEKYSVEDLKRIRANYVAENNLDGYYQEYLNNPVAEGSTFFRPQDFKPMEPKDYDSHKVYFAAADFAISEDERADYTVIMIVGMDKSGNLHVVDVRRGRWDADEIISELISVQRRYDPEIFTFETEKIDKAIGPSLKREMIRTGQFLNIKKITPTKSKTTRGRSIQKMMRAGAVRWDMNLPEFEDMKAELLTMTPSGPRGTHDDYFDAFAYIGLTIDLYYEAETEEELADEEYEDELEHAFEFGEQSTCVTGY